MGTWQPAGTGRLCTSVSPLEVFCVFCFFLTCLCGWFSVVCKFYTEVDNPRFYHVDIEFATVKLLKLLLTSLEKSIELHLCKKQTKKKTGTWEKNTHLSSLVYNIIMPKHSWVLKWATHNNIRQFPGHNLPSFQARKRGKIPTLTFLKVIFPESEAGISKFHELSVIPGGENRLSTLHPSALWCSLRETPTHSEKQDASADVHRQQQYHTERNASPSPLWGSSEM